MKISVSVKVSEKADAYTFTDIAAASLETNAPWDEIKPTAARRAIDSVVEDVLGRVEYQLKAEHMRRREEERAAEVEDSFA